MIFQRIESRQHPDYEYSYFRKLLFRKTANVLKSSIDVILMRLGADHYPNFENHKITNFESIKTLPLQFRKDSFWSE